MVFVDIIVACTNIYSVYYFDKYVKDCKAILYDHMLDNMKYLIFGKINVIKSNFLKINKFFY